MAHIAPFRALRYDFRSNGGDVSNFVAPPYDVLDQAEKQRLLATESANIVAVDLPYAPAKSLGPPHGYEVAGRTLRRWMQERTIICEDRPAIYVYHQCFDYDKISYVRRMFIALLRLEPFSAGVVVPHEETFGGPKEDRLALMKATHTQLSPIYGLYRDESDDISQALTRRTSGTPDALARLEGVENRLWIESDPHVVDRITSAFSDKKVYIADGHHRYNTALNYREWVTQQLNGHLPDDHPAQFVMMVFGSMDDQGSLILPTHRVLTNVGQLKMDSFLELWADGCEECEPRDADMTIFHGASRLSKPIRFTRREKLATLEPNKSPAWRSLDVAYLHRYLIDERLRSLLQGQTTSIQYIKSEEQARQLASERQGVALLCKPPTMAQLRSVGEAGDLMPQKSTFFYPKVVTGFTLHSLQ